MKFWYDFIERIPIKIRLSLGHAVWLCVIFICLGFGVFRVVEESVLTSLDATLMASAKTIRDAQLTHRQKLSAFHDPLYWESVADEFLGDQRYIRAYAQLVDTSGKVRARTPNIRVNLPVTPIALARAEQGLETYEYFRISSGGTLRQLTLPIMRESRFAGELIQVGSTMASTLSTINSVKSMLLVTLSLGLIVSVIFGYLLINWSLKPVARMTYEVSRLGFNDSFEHRIKLPPADDDLRVLAKTFNEMLSRIDEGVAKLRRFAGDVSHELRTPLAVLRGEAELALRRERTGEEYQSALRVVVQESLQMTDIVEELLLLAKAQGRAIAIDWYEPTLEDFIAGVVKMVKPTFEQKGVEINLQFNGLQDLQIRVGGIYLALAIKNLLLNACKYSHPKGKVELVTKLADEAVLIEVEDFGEGIPEESLPFVFDLFYRVDSARNRSNGGVGIGLSLAKALIGLHNGHIMVRSTFGRGTAFAISLPRNIDSKEKMPRESGKTISLKTISLKIRQIFVKNKAFGLLKKIRKTDRFSVK